MGSDPVWGEESIGDHPLGQAARYAAKHASRPAAKCSGCTKVTAQLVCRLVDRCPLLVLDVCKCSVNKFQPSSKGRGLSRCQNMTNAGTTAMEEEYHCVVKVADGAGAQSHV